SRVDADLKQRPLARIERRIAQRGRQHFAEALEARNFRLGVLPQLLQDRFLMRVVTGPKRFLTRVNAIKRRLGDIKMSLPNQIGEIAKEKRKQERGDV